MSLTTCIAPGCDDAPIAHKLCPSHYSRVRRALKAKGLDPSNFKDLSVFEDLYEKPVARRGREDRQILSRIPAEHFDLIEWRAMAQNTSVYEIVREIVAEWASDKAVGQPGDPDPAPDPTPAPTKPPKTRKRRAA